MIVPAVVEALALDNHPPKEHYRRLLAKRTITRARAVGFGETKHEYFSWSSPRKDGRNRGTGRRRWYPRPPRAPRTWHYFRWSDGHGGRGLHDSRRRAID